MTWFNKAAQPEQAAASRNGTSRDFSGDRVMEKREERRFGRSYRPHASSPGRPRGRIFARFSWRN